MHTSRSGKPRIIITTGDPAGIGPEVTAKALASPKVKGLADFLIIGDTGIRSRRAGLLTKKECGFISINNLDRALAVLAKDEADALVTAPVNKASVRAAGFSDFEGHTEYLADATLTKNYEMIFIGAKLKVALVTRHIPLKNVPGAISTEKIYKAIELARNALVKYFSISDPRIGVCGLNPHAGELGLFGSEEKEVIEPAVKKAARLSKNIFGPLPSDVVFYDAINGKYDAVIAMYHDQALVPFKMLYFKDGVNMTLGLPFIRTSPDHGTALDIAGKGIADPSSMIAAIRLAARLAPKHHAH
jgi:4-hydroxythreonine-4-phosphate dehydrogenase